ncbi:peptidoglycan DD-metalloendopeptidase family protein [Paenibacillus hodogayensis]|uniref:Peptidoglycan DD-metalloendopeptidase family protein n=1 Tax=Paenibacillus hodogayensis TaxID=279208 RepID=A0ABV5VVU3_9BACL
MEVKSSVRKRRMDRMKQIVASERGEHPHRSAPDWTGAAWNSREPQPYRVPADPDGRPEDRRSSPGEDRLREPLPLQWEYGQEDDPEYVWKSQERERWSSLEQAGRASGGEWRSGGGGGLKPPSTRQIGVKLVVSVALFGAVWGVFQLNHPLAEQGRQWVRTALTEDYDFAAMSAWYEREFGGLPAFLPALGIKSDPQAQKASSPSPQRLYTPVHGKIVEAAKDGELGITIRTGPEAAVAALDTGRVAAVNTGTDKGTVVVIQHAGGLQSTYGWLQSTRLKPNDWIQGGETVGVAATDAAGGAGKLYLAVKKDNQPIDPAEVIPFD